MYYTGHGEVETGNWCFKDGTICLHEILALYSTCFHGKLLYIFTDCCYSGHWVVELAKYLDNLGIGACGHQAREQGLLFKIVASCEPDQKAADAFFFQMVQFGLIKKIKRSGFQHMAKYLKHRTFTDVTSQELCAINCNGPQLLVGYLRYTS